MTKEELIELVEEVAESLIPAEVALMTACAEYNEDHPDDPLQAELYVLISKEGDITTPDGEVLH